MYKTIFSLVLLSGILLTACGSGSVSENENHENNKEETKETTQNEEPASEEVDDVEGTLWEADGDVGIVLAHGAAYDADSWEEQGKEFAKENIPAFAVEDTSEKAFMDAAEMLKEEQEVQKVAIVGASAGGASAIEAVEADETVFDKVVLLSPGGDATAIEETPVLVIYSEEEGFDDLEEDQPDNLETIAISGDAHAQELFQDEEKSDKVMSEMIEFLDE